jgi:hypothetical protein
MGTMVGSRKKGKKDRTTFDQTEDMQSVREVDYCTEEVPMPLVALVAPLMVA